MANLRKLLASQTIWSLGDQGMVSLGNFAVNIILARNVPIADFGVYALAFGVFLFLNGLHGSFVNYPLTIRIARGGAQEIPRLAGLGLTFTALLIFPLGIGVVVLFALLDRWLLIPCAMFAFAAWRFQDVLRRALMAQLKHSKAVPGDGISYLGQAAAMISLAYFDLLTLDAAFLAIGATSALAAVVQAIQVRVRFSPPAALLPFVKECWELGRWVVWRRLVSVVPMQGIGWVLAAVHGVEATAHFRAAVNILGVTHPIMEGIGNLMLPSVAHAHRESMKQALRVTWHLGLQAGVLVLPYFFFLMLFPDFALGMLYGPESPYGALGQLLVIMAIGYVLNFLARLLTGTLSGLAKPALTFYAQLYAAIVAVFVSIPLAAWGGIYFAAIGSVLVQAVRLTASAFFLRREVLREIREVRGPETVGSAR